jgi:DNA-binding NarL/FixJ family response regulator
MITGDVLVVTKDTTTIATVQSAMASHCGDTVPDTCRSVAELMSRLARPGANGHIGVAMVDIDHDPDRTLFDLSRVIATHPKIRFMVLSTDSSEGLILQAMQAGARHFRQAEHHDGAGQRPGASAVVEPQATVRLGM